MFISSFLYSTFVNYVYAICLKNLDNSYAHLETNPFRNGINSVSYKEVLYV